eukprot:859527_1
MATNASQLQHNPDDIDMKDQSCNNNNTSNTNTKLLNTSSELVPPSPFNSHNTLTKSPKRLPPQTPSIPNTALRNLNISTPTYTNTENKDIEEITNNNNNNNKNKNKNKKK